MRAAVATMLGGTAVVLACAVPAYADLSPSPTPSPSAEVQQPGPTIPPVLHSPTASPSATVAPTPTAAPTTAAPVVTTRPPAPVVRRTTRRPAPVAVATSAPPASPLPDVQTTSGLTFNVRSTPGVLDANPAAASGGSPTRHLERMLQAVLALGLLLGAAGATGLYLTREGR